LKEKTFICFENTANEIRAVYSNNTKQQVVEVVVAIMMPSHTNDTPTIRRRCRPLAQKKTRE